MKIGGVTHQNLQPEPPARKPNEDAFRCLKSDQTVVGVVMDGIPVLRNSEGNYPNENGAIASRVASDSICAFMRSREPSERLCLDVFRYANDQIRSENEKRGIYKKKEPQWISTVGCVLLADVPARNVYFGYIGDPLAFIIRPSGEAALLTEDQLKPFEDHLYACHRHMFSDPGANVAIREHQDKYVRNRMDAECFCGVKLRGWGALTGQADAMRFVSVVSLAAPPGTRFVLASDAIEAIGAGNAKERKVGDYLNAFDSIRDLVPQKAAEALLRMTRDAEREKRCKSDDATFVVADF